MLGEIVRIRKGYTYNKTRQPWGHIVIYEALFYNENEKIIGWVGDNKPFTLEKRFRKKSELKRFLNGNGYYDFMIENS